MAQLRRLVLYHYVLAVGASIAVVADAVDNSTDIPTREHEHRDCTSVHEETTGQAKVVECHTQRRSVAITHSTAAHNCQDSHG